MKEILAAPYSHQPGQVLFIVGATASGKSDFALELAETIKGEIFNCDSIQCYKHLNIGAAKPSAEDRARVPHHLLDFVDHPDELTAGEYARRFIEIWTPWKEAKFSKGITPILVGGTGFYFQALEKGLLSIPPSDLRLRAELEGRLKQEGSAVLYSELMAVDPESARKISVNDHYRIVRAFEVYLQTGKALSFWKEEHSGQPNKGVFSGLSVRKIGIHRERDELRARIQRRTELMIERGLIEEVEGFLKKSWGGWAPLGSVGYKETAEYLAGNIKTEQELIARIALSTSQLAKRQITWFQRDSSLEWIQSL